MLNPLFSNLTQEIIIKILKIVLSISYFLMKYISFMRELCQVMF